MTARRTAIIGCGLIGTKRAMALPGSLELVAVHDLHRHRAERLAAAIDSTPKVVDEVADAIGIAGPDGLVVVATQHDSLAACAVQAVVAGCHVLIEKPGARRSVELEPVAYAAAATDRTVRVGFNHRFHPAIRAAQAAIASGAHRPFLIRARYGHGGRLGYEQEWRTDPERSGGGELLDQGVHLLDLLKFFAGQPSLRYAALSTQYWAISVEDNAFLHLQLEDGGDAWLHASWTEWKNIFSFEITCPKIKLEVNGLGGSYGPERLSVFELSEQLGPPLSTTTEWPPNDESWRDELEDVVAAIEGRPSIGASLDDAVGVLRIIDEAYRA